MAQKFEDKLAARKLLLGLRTQALFGLEEDAQQTLASTRLQRCIRLNPLAQAIEVTTKYLRDAGVHTESPEWLPTDCYLLADPQVSAAEVAVQNTLADGKAFLQNPSSFIPVLALEPKPGERILDLCASPGGKTSYIAALSANAALITANDTSYDRLQRLRRVCKLLNVSVDSFTMTKGEASSKRFPPESFDKILIDAPCSGEDIRLLAESDLGSWSPAKVKRLAELQKKLLKEAWKLLKPGGVLVYSTCSQAPEEDEAVISWFLFKHEDAATLPIESSLGMPAFTQWNGSKFYVGTERAVRVKPDAAHISFFACRMTKTVA